MLRVKVLEFIDEEDRRVKLLRSRKIHATKMFEAYFCEFCELLREGPLNKLRLNPESTEKIERRVEMTG